MIKLSNLAQLFFLPLVAFGSNGIDYYNLYDNGIAPEPKEQVWGTCWAFSSVYSLESDLNSNEAWTNSTLEPRILSPYHMDKFSGFTRSGHDKHVNDSWYSGQGKEYSGSNLDNLEEGLVVHLGGDFHAAAAYLTNNGGAVTAWSLPELNYTNKPHQKFSQITKQSSRYRRYMPRSIQWLELSKDHVTDLKRAIIKNGVVSTMQYMHQKPRLYSSEGREIHFYGGNKKPNHAINIIGWDDKMAMPPLLPGMWIVVDSDHVDDYEIHIGQFYIPYADTYVGRTNKYGPVQFTGVHETNFKTIYSHARHGWTNTFSSSDEVKNKYFVKSEERIQSVGLYATQAQDEILVKVQDPRGRDLCAQTQLRNKDKGFYLVNLSCKPHSGEVDIILASKSKEYATDGTKLFDLLLQLGSKGRELPPEGEPVLVKSKSLPSQSFYKKNGKWRDLYHYKWPSLEVQGRKIIRDKSANFAINLYTTDIGSDDE